MNYTTSHYIWSSWDTFRIPTDQISPSQTLRCPGACDFPPWGSRTFQFQPTGLHGLCFGFWFAGPLPLRSLSHGPLSRVHFVESLVVRLYSEIDHIHLSSEAQCVSHHLPQVDFHMLHATSEGLQRLCQRLRGRKNWVCLGGVPPSVQLYAQWAAWEGYQGAWDTQRPTWEGVEGQAWLRAMVDWECNWMLKFLDLYNEWHRHCHVCVITLFWFLPPHFYPPKPLIHTPLYSGGKFWVAPPGHTPFFALRICSSWTAGCTLRIRDRSLIMTLGVGKLEGGHNFLSIPVGGHFFRYLFIFRVFP